jgi:hypothetical protein
VSALGRLKEYYHDELSMGAQRWVSEVFFICPVCSNEIRQEVDVPEPNYAGEKSSDMVSEGEVEIHCDGCDNYFDGDVWAGPAHCDITLREHPETTVSCDPPGYDRPPEDWDDWKVPDDPASVFKANVTELHQLIDQQAQADGSSLMNRMIFAQILTFLEAYFCDTLISELRQRPDLLANFAERDGSISHTGFSASAILRDPDHVRKAVEHNLKSRLYHQFGSGKVDGKGKPKAEGVPLWYAMAFGFSLAATDNDLKSLREYAALRHDCVHRNGKTKDDKVLNLFEKTYLMEALALAERIVNHIEASIRSMSPAKPEPF